MSTLTMSWGDAVRAQLVLLQRLGRTRTLLAVAALAVVFSTFALLRSPGDASGIVSLVVLEMHGLLVVVAAGWGIATWWHEPPARRELLHSRPIDITQHELARIAAGAVWLIAALAFTVLASVLIQLGFGRPPIAESVAPAAWLALFSGPLLAYVFTVTASTATRRSLELILAGMIVLTFAYGIAVEIAFRQGSLWDVRRLGGYSPFTALGGISTRTVRTTAYGADGGALEQYRMAYGMSMDPYWADASLLWWTIALAALAFVLWRRRRA